MANFFDLNPKQTKSTDGKYIDLVFTDFVPSTDYGLTFAWVYEDPKLGVSGESNIFNFTTIGEPELAAPHFTSEDLYGINSILYINWNGKDALGQDYISGKIKQVNVWIKGGDFGEEFKQYGTSFTKAGTLQINATQKATYCVKLQAEGTTSGLLSPFSEAFCVTLLKQPKAVYDVRHEWDNSGNLSLFWKFDPTFKDSTNDNTLADSFGLQLLDDTNDVDATWWTSVEKDKIPPLEQKIIISANQLQKVFGQFTAFEIDYTGAIYVRDKNLQTSFVTGYSVSKYSDPLTAPTISAVKAPMAYNVSYTANSLFDKIYVEESTNGGSTWTNVAVTSANPAYIATTNSLSRNVRAKFSKKLGGFTDYSNTVTVVPDKIDPTDTTPPTNPTDVSATASVDLNNKTGFSVQATISFTKSSDADCRGYRIRWTTQTTNPIYEYGYVDHPSSGTTVSFTVSGLIPDVTYYYQVAAVDQFNNTQSYTTSGTFVAQDSIATAEGSLARLKSYISIGGATGDLFKFGTGISESINTSTTTTPSLSSGTYHGILLNKTGNKNNFWLTTGQLRVGTDTQFMYFNGTDLYLTGDINARSGKITGNLTMTGGGSVIARTADGSANKVTLSYAGLFAYDANGTETTQIISNAAAGAATFTTTKALIGNWTVDTNTISAGGVTLNSAGSIVATNSGSYVGIKPRVSAGTDIVLWSGNTASPAINSASSGQAGFQVNANGQLYATGAIISGVITADSGSSLGGLLSDTSKVYYSSTTPTAPTGGFKVGDSWVDTSSNNVLKIWSGSQWVVAQDSEAAKSIAITKNKTTYGSTQPVNPISGDVWFDTNTGINYFKVYNGTSWVRMKDSDITAAQSAAATAQSTADTKAQTTYGTTAPVSPKSGDIWFDTNFSYFKRYNGTSWDRMKDADITAAAAAAAAAQGDAGTALSKAAKFGVDGSLVQSLGIKLNDGGSIYSTYTGGAKSSYSSDSTPGFFIGWENQAGVIYPAFNVGNANAYVKYSNYTQALEVKGTVKATAGSFDGNVTAGGGAITIGPSGISTTSNKFRIDTSGNAYFSGTLEAGTVLSNGQISGGTISGSTITTNGTGWGRVRLNSSNNTLEFLNDVDTVTGAIYQFNNGGELLLQHGNKTAFNYPASSAYMTLNPSTISLGYTDGNGYSRYTISIASTGEFNFYGKEVKTNYGGAIGTGNYYIRNIGMGTGPKTTTDTDGLRGDVWIQYA
jgi:chitin-binding protein